MHEVGIFITFGTYIKQQLKFRQVIRVQTISNTRFLNDSLRQIKSPAIHSIVGHCAIITSSPFWIAGDISFIFFFDFPTQEWSILIILFKETSLKVTIIIIIFQK